MTSKTSQGPVAVVGVTGAVGRRVAAKLAAKEIPVQCIARDPSRFFGPPSAKLVPADLTDRSEAERVLNGCRALYLTLPEMGDDPLGLELSVGLNAVQAAKNAGIQHLVLHTALRSDRGDTGAGIIDNKKRIEETIERSGLGYTILRPGWFLQNLFGAKDYLAQGMFSFPMPPERRIGGVSVEDIANAAVAFLQMEPQGRGIDLHIPGGVTGPAIAEAAARVLGRPVQFFEFTGSAREYVEPFPISAKHKDLYGELFEYFRRQDYLGNAEEILRVLPDFHYTTLDGFLQSELFAA